MKYANDNEVADFVGRFERGEIARDDWRHRDHLTVALYYLSNFSADVALTRMRDGIHGLLRSFGIDPRGTGSPYHETLTVFWVTELENFRAANPGTGLAALEQLAADAFDKDYPLRFYSRDKLYGSFARREYLAPDLDGDAK